MATATPGNIMFNFNARNVWQVHYLDYFAEKWRARAATERTLFAC